MRARTKRDPGTVTARAGVKARRAYSYRDAPAVPAWDDARGLVVYDGECVLCSGFVHFVVRFDRRAFFLLTAAQSPLGQALYRHYGLDASEFETNLVIVDGRLFEKLGAFCAVMTRIGWPWRPLGWLRFLPLWLTDWLYDRMAKNRYAVFGRRDTCLGPAELEGRYIE